MSKPKIPVELQVILKDLCIAESDDATLLRKVHTRAALQVRDYLQIIVSKFELHTHGKAQLAQTIDDTRRLLQHVEHADDAAEEQHEAHVVVQERG